MCLTRSVSYRKVTTGQVRGVTSVVAYLRTPYLLSVAETRDNVDVILTRLLS